MSGSQASHAVGDNIEDETELVDAENSGGLVWYLIKSLRKLLSDIKILS